MEMFDAYLVFLLGKMLFDSCQPNLFEHERFYRIDVGNLIEG